MRCVEWVTLYFSRDKVNHILDEAWGGKLLINSWLLFFWSKQVLRIENSPFHFCMSPLDWIRQVPTIIKPPDQHTLLFIHNKWSYFYIELYSFCAPPVIADQSIVSFSLEPTSELNNSPEPIKLSSYPYPSSSTPRKTPHLFEFEFYKEYQMTLIYKIIISASKRTWNRHQHTNCHHDKEWNGTSWRIYGGWFLLASEWLS